jgi:hypothetical protein
MVLYQLWFYIDKEKLEGYTKFAKDESIPHWLSVPGMKEFRAYREPGSLKVLVEMEFESMEAWGKAFDSQKTKEVSNKFASFTHDLKWNLWDKSPMVPEPLKGKNK